MTLREKYNHAIQVAKGFRMEGSADERDGKLYFHGSVNSQDEVNRIWDAIKTVPDWRNDVVAEPSLAGAIRGRLGIDGTDGPGEPQPGPGLVPLPGPDGAPWTGAAVDAPGVPQLVLRFDDVDVVDEQDQLGRLTAWARRRWAAETLVVFH